MIVEMHKMYVVTHRRNGDDLLAALGALGVVHLKAVDPARASAAEDIAALLGRVRRAIQILAGTPAAGVAPSISADAAVEEALSITQRCSEHEARLDALHRQMEQLAVWGDLSLQQLDELRDVGVEVKFFDVPAALVDEVHADVASVLHELPGKRVLLATAEREVELSVPDEARELPLPERDRPSIRAEATAIDAELRRDRTRLAALAHLLGDLRAEQSQLEERASWSRAERGAWCDENLFAVQGFSPAESAEAIEEALRDRNIEAAVRFLEVAPDEQPPTLVRYPRWARPIKAVFDVLGTVPGYREYDLSPFFMVALPIFAAMLFGDAGYGMIFTLLGLTFYGKIRTKAGGPTAQLVLVFGLTALAWGMLTGNYFGVSPTNMLAAGGIWAALGRAATSVALLWSANEEVARNIIIKVSFVFGTIHLVLAHLRQALGFAPNLKALAEIGWSCFLAGMLGVIWMLFFPDDMWMSTQIMFSLLIAGAALVVLFSHPSVNPAKMLGLGVIANILPMISTFSDTISYIRLMAVGLASYYIASAFNGLGSSLAAAGWWAIPLGAIVIVLAHLLNIALGFIAVFAHGIRLNMLEFSSNAGVQWSGYAYAPFATQTTEGES